MTANNATENGFLYSHGKMIDLGTLGGANSRAFGINNSGEVVGLSNIAAGSTQSSIFLYRHGHMTSLVGPVDPTETFGDIKINSKGDVIGFPLSDGDASIDHKGNLIDLGSLAGLGSAARDLNDHDEVVGYSGVSGTGSTRVNHAFLYKNGTVIDLGTLGGPGSVANDINAHGEIVGSSMTTSGATHAFLYRNTHMTDLGTLGGADSVAGAINNSGEVVGALSRAPVTPMASSTKTVS